MLLKYFFISSKSQLSPLWLIWASKIQVSPFKLNLGTIMEMFSFARLFQALSATPVHTPLELNKNLCVARVDQYWWSAPELALSFLGIHPPCMGHTAQEREWDPLSQSKSGVKDSAYLIRSRSRGFFGNSGFSCYISPGWAPDHRLLHWDLLEVN